MIHILFLYRPLYSKLIDSIIIIIITLFSIYLFPSYNCPFTLPDATYCILDQIGVGNKTWIWQKEKVFPFFKILQYFPFLPCDTLMKNLNESIHTVDLKHCPKIHFESIKLINTVDLLSKLNGDIMTHQFSSKRSYFFWVWELMIMISCTSS